MRGEALGQEALFSYVSTETRVPANHPLRPLRTMVEAALGELDRAFAAVYARDGRPSIPPEQLIRAGLLQILYSVRSERLLMEQLDYNLLFRWFVGLGVDDPVWNHSTFSKNRDRILTEAMAGQLLERVLDQARAAQLLSDEHFSVDGTLIEAWASMKSFRPKGEDPPPPTDGGDRNPEVDFTGQPRSNDTHASTSDPEARLYRKSKGTAAKLAYLGHAVTENRNGLIVATGVTHATGTAECEAALAMVKEIPGSHRITVGADKGYDTTDFVQDLRACRTTPHVAQHYRGRRSAIDGRTTRHRGYAVSQRKRKRIEEVFGWGKTVGLMRKVKLRGLPKISAFFTLNAVAYNLVRMRNLLDPPHAAKPQGGLVPG